mgnify:CR=1 FL=1
MVTTIKKIFFTIFLIINLVMVVNAHDSVKQYFSSSDYFNVLKYLSIQIFFAILMLFFLGKVFNKTIRKIIAEDDTPMTLEKAQKAYDEHEAAKNIDKLLDH